MGISADADEKTLKKAFRQLALKFHPDVNHSPDASERFQELCEAYEVLLRHITYQTTIHTNRQYANEEADYSYEDVLREARAAANARARMKYEKMKAEREFFEQSGWREVILFFNYTGRVLAFPLVIFLLVFPVYIAFKEGFGRSIIPVFFWIIGGFLLNQMFTYRKSWFHQGKFRWKLKDFFKLFDFSPITKNPDSDCYYCNNNKADARSRNFSFQKIRSIIYQHSGAFQHSSGYNRKFKEVVIPTSVRARKVHFAQSVIKLSSMLASLLFVPFPDFIWRFCFGLALGLFLSGILLWFTKTRSKVSYLLSYFMIIKIIVWLMIIISQSTLYPGFILDSNQFTPFYLFVLILFGDMIMDLILRMFPFYHRIYHPVFSQGPVIDRLFREGYQNYLDVPVWSTIYPLFTWFF